MKPMEVFLGTHLDRVMQYALKTHTDTHAKPL